MCTSYCNIIQIKHYIMINDFIENLEFKKATDAIY